MTTVLSAGWIQTEYNNQSSPSSFYTIVGEGAKVILRGAVIRGFKTGL